MSDTGDATEAIVGLIFGGFTLILIGESIPASFPVDLTDWGMLFLLAGVLLATTIVAVFLNEL